MTPEYSNPNSARFHFMKTARKTNEKEEKLEPKFKSDEHFFDDDDITEHDWWD